MKTMNMRRSTVSLGIAIALAAGSMSSAVYTGGGRHGDGNHPGNDSPSKGKYLIAWMGDQMLDGNNCSPLDNVLALRGPEGSFDSTADCKGLLPANLIRHYFQGGIKGKPGFLLYLLLTFKFSFFKIFYIV